MTVPEPRLPDYLDHILEAIRRIRTYTEDIVEVAFLEDTLVQDGVIRNIEVIGEAAKNVEQRYPEFSTKHPEVPWGLVYAMRNRVAHGYFKIDLEIVWQTIQDYLPELELHLTKLRASLL